MRKPIAWMKELVPQNGLEWQVVLTAHEEMAKDWEEPVIPLYTKQEWVGMTVDEIAELVCNLEDPETRIELGKKIKAKLKEKNT